jgi:hypothetical protein
MQVLVVLVEALTAEVLLMVRAHLPKLILVVVAVVALLADGGIAVVKATAAKVAMAALVLL